MMTWSRLLTDWQNYLAAMVEQPYNPDRVQALGMRFAEAWNHHKTPICWMCAANLDEFDYSKWRSWMPQVKEWLDRIPATS